MRGTYAAVITRPENLNACMIQKNVKAQIYTVHNTDKNMIWKFQPENKM